MSVRNTSRNHKNNRHRPIKLEKPNGWVLSLTGDHGWEYLYFLNVTANNKFSHLLILKMDFSFKFLCVWLFIVFWVCMRPSWRGANTNLVSPALCKLYYPISPTRGSPTRLSVLLTVVEPPEARWEVKTVLWPALNAELKAGGWFTEFSPTLWFLYPSVLWTRVFGV